MNPINDPTQLSLAQLFELPEYQAGKDAYFADLRSKYATQASFQRAVASLKYDWNFNARPKQKTPAGDWLFWLIRSGRGFGKTRTGAEWIKEKEAEARKAKKAKTLEMAICNKTYTDLVEVNVKAILDCYSDLDPNKPEFTNRKIVWKSGAICYLVAAQTPEQFRGKNLSYLWIDELAKFLYPKKVWEQARFSVRRDDVQFLITTTPSAKAKDILKSIENQELGKAVVTYGSSYENSTNSEEWRRTVLGAYEGTKLGKQEIYGGDADYSPGALWSIELIKYWDDFVETKELQAKEKGQPLASSWQAQYKANFWRIVVGVDPAVTSHAKSDETGIVVCARDHQGNGFVLEDVSGRYSPNEWAKLAVKMFHKWKAKCVVIEKNNGGDTLANTIHMSDPRVPVEQVHASQSKIDRATPVARLYEQNRIYHMQSFDILEDQMCNYGGVRPKEGDYDIESNKAVSPDRLDACVHAFRYLFSDLIKSPGRGFTKFLVSAY